MPTNDELRESVDLASELADFMKDIASSNSAINSRLQQSNKNLLDLNQVSEYFARNMKGLPADILTGSDLLKGMVSDSKLLNRVREESLDLGKKLLSEWHDKEFQSLLEQTKLAKERAVSQEALSEARIDEAKKIGELAASRLRLEDKLEEDLNRQLKILTRQEKKTEKLNFNFKSMVDTMGGMIRAPSKAADSLLNKLGGLPTTLINAKEETGSWGGALKKSFGESGAGKFAKLIGRGGPIVLGLGVAAVAATALFALFKNFWEFMDKNIMPATAEFNKQVGSMGSGGAQLKKQMMSTGVQFELLGKSFEEGARLVRDFAANLNTVDLDPAILKTGKELIGVLGLTGQEAGKLSLQFIKQTGSLDELNQMMDAGAAEARAWGIPVNEVLRDMAQAPDVLARFGIANSMEFEKATTKARTYGLTIKEVNAAFGKQMDTFEGSADAAAKLNAVFGTQINSMRLMMETDPTKRMIMLRQELEKQGKSWEKLTVFERNMITQTLGVNEAQASLILSSEEERKKLEAKRKEKEKDLSVNEKWNKGIQSMKVTLIAWGKEIDKVMRSITEFFSILFTGEKPGKNFADMASTISSSLRSVTGVFRSATEMAKDFRKVLEEFSETKIGKVLSTLTEITTPSFTDALLGPVGIMKGMSERALGKLFGTKVDDAIITKDGKIIETNPADNIIATKSPVIPTLAGPAIATDHKTSSTSSQSNERPIQVNLFIGPEKIAETLVRVSRSGVAM